MERKELTRDSDLYEEVMRNKVINGSEFESQFTSDLSLDYTIDYNCDLQWKSLDHNKSFSDISIRRLGELQSMSKVRLAEEAGKDRTSHTWKATGSVNFEIDIEYKVKLPGSKEVVAVTSLDLNSLGDKCRAQDIISSAVGSEPVDVTLENGEIIVNTGQNVFRSELIQEFSKYGSSREDQLIRYLASDGLYVGSDTGDLRYEDDRVYIPVMIDDAEIEFGFDQPESNQDFWKIAELYGQGDPLLIANSEVFTCLSHLDNNSGNLMEDGLFTVHREPKYNLLQNVLRFFNLENRV